ncbi:MAG: threonine-phosphate decarboxylase CobD [Elusimicrobiota bacterium]
MNLQHSRHGGNIWQIAKEYKIPIEKIIDFSTNINPLGIPNRVENKLIENMHLISYYPDPYCSQFIQKLSETLCIKKENILVGNGSTELIYTISAAISPKKVVIPIPTFSEYENSVKAHNAEIEFYICREENNFKINIARMIKLLPYSQMIFVCNPNNPTGSVLSKEELVFLAKKCQQNNVLLLIDETYINFVIDDEDFTMIHNIDNNQIIVLRSFTKFFAIPGLRLGYMVANKNIIEKIKKFQPVWSVNILAQIAACEIIKDKEYIQKTKEYIQIQAKILRGHFVDIYDIIKPYPTVTNFILCRFNRSYNYNHIFRRLIQEHGIIVRNCSNFRRLSNRYFRVAIRTEKENKKLIHAFWKVLE